MATSRRSGSDRDLRRSGGDSDHRRSGSDRDHRRSGSDRDIRRFPRTRKAPRNCQQFEIDDLRHKITNVDRDADSLRWRMDITAFRGRQTNQLVRKTESRLFYQLRQIRKHLGGAMPAPPRTWRSRSPRPRSRSPRRSRRARWSSSERPVMRESPECRRPRCTAPSWKPKAKVSYPPPSSATSTTSSLGEYRFQPHRREPKDRNSMSDLSQKSTD